MQCLAASVSIVPLQLLDFFGSLVYFPSSAEQFIQSAILQKLKRRVTDMPNLLGGSRDPGFTYYWWSGGNSVLVVASATAGGNSNCVAQLPPEVQCQ